MAKTIHVNIDLCCLNWVLARKTLKKQHFIA